MRAAVGEEESEQKMCYSGESIRHGTQKMACPQPDPGLQLGVWGVGGGWFMMTRAPPEWGEARRRLQVSDHQLITWQAEFQGSDGSRWVFINSSVSMVLFFNFHFKQFKLTYYYNSTDGIQWNSTAIQWNQGDLEADHFLLMISLYKCWTAYWAKIWHIFYIYDRTDDRQQPPTCSRTLEVLPSLTYRAAVQCVSVCPAVQQVVDCDSGGGWETFHLQIPSWAPEQEITAGYLSLIMSEKTNN